MDECKKEVVSLETPSIPTIYENFVVSVKDSGLDLISKIPEYNSVKSGLYKLRNSNLGLSKTTPREVHDVKVPDIFTYFLFADYEDPGTRIMIFCLKENLKKISDIKHLLMDGTFKSTPVPFYQIYTIHGDFGSTYSHNHVIPLFYVFMTNRNTESYEILFQILKSRVPELNPTKISIDFEIAAIKAVRKIYPEAAMIGCWYHFQRNLWKKGRDLGFKKSKVTWRIISLCSVLPLLPATHIEQGWNYICTQMNNHNNQFTKLRRYMEKYFNPASFWHNIWITVGERHRTNNCVEAWNSIINKRLGRKKPNFVSVLNYLTKDAKRNAVRIKLNRKIKRTQKQMLYDNFIQECQLEVINNEISVPLFLEKIK